MSGKKKNKHRNSASAELPQLELMQELVAIVERTRSGALSAEEHEKLKTAISTLTFLTAELQKKQTSLARLRRLLFGAATEKTRLVLEASSSPPLASTADHAADYETEPRAKAAGHGRHGAAAYAGAETVTVPHPALPLWPKAFMRCRKTSGRFCTEITAPR